MQKKIEIQKIKNEIKSQQLIQRELKISQQLIIERKLKNQYLQKLLKQSENIVVNQKKVVQSKVKNQLEMIVNEQKQLKERQNVFKNQRQKMIQQIDKIRYMKDKQQKQKSGNIGWTGTIVGSVVGVGAVITTYDPVISTTAGYGSAKYVDSFFKQKHTQNSTKDLFIFNNVKYKTQRDRIKITKIKKQKQFNKKKQHLKKSQNQLKQIQKKQQLIKTIADVVKQQKQKSINQIKQKVQSTKIQKKNIIQSKNKRIQNIKQIDNQMTNFSGKIQNKRTKVSQLRKQTQKINNQLLKKKQINNKNKFFHDVNSFLKKSHSTQLYLLGQNLQPQFSDAQYRSQQQEQEEQQEHQQENSQQEQQLDINSVFDNQINNLSSLVNSYHGRINSHIFKQLQEFLYEYKNQRSLNDIYHDYHFFQQIGEIVNNRKYQRQNLANQNYTNLQQRSEIQSNNSNLSYQNSQHSIYMENQDLNIFERAYKLSQQIGNKSYFLMALRWASKNPRANPNKFIQVNLKVIEIEKLIPSILNQYQDPAIISRQLSNCIYKTNQASQIQFLFEREGRDFKNSLFNLTASILYQINPVRNNINFDMFTHSQRFLIIKRLKQSKRLLTNRTVKILEILTKPNNNQQYWYRIPISDLLINLMLAYPQQLNLLSYCKILAILKQIRKALKRQMDKTTAITYTVKNLRNINQQQINEILLLNQQTQYCILQSWACQN